MPYDSKEKKREYYLKNREEIRRKTKEYYLKNREEECIKRREYSKKNKELFRNIELKRRFGITLEQYNEMHEKQNGLCAICGKEETAFDSRQKCKRRLAVDHCHTTGKVRALLCGKCNKAIGLLNDDVNLMNNAINYLNKYNGK